MDLWGIVIMLVIGGVAGWLAGLIMKGGGFGIMGNIIVGILGSFLGGWLLSLVNIGVSGYIGTILGAVLGAVVLLFIVGLFKK